MSNRTCSIEGCERPYRCKGFCNMHYNRWRTKGDPGEPEQKIMRYSPGDTCRVSGCPARCRSKGLCHTHYMRWRATGDPGEPERRKTVQGERCIVEGCENGTSRKNMCGMHYKRWMTYGDTGDPRSHYGRDDVSYTTAHRRMASAFGNATEHPCCECGDEADEWAYDHMDPNERVSDRGRPYSVDASHFMPMCRPCHRAFDQGVTRPAAR